MVTGEYPYTYWQPLSNCGFNSDDDAVKFMDLHLIMITITAAMILTVMMIYNVVMVISNAAVMMVTMMTLMMRTLLIFLAKTGNVNSRVPIVEKKNTACTYERRLSYGLQNEQPYSTSLSVHQDPEFIIDTASNFTETMLNRISPVFIKIKKNV